MLLLEVFFEGVYSDYTCKNKTIQKLSYSKTYMFYSLKLMYYKFGWLIKLAKKYLIR